MQIGKILAPKTVRCSDSYRYADQIELKESRIQPFYQAMQL